MKKKAKKDSKIRKFAVIGLRKTKYRLPINLLNLCALTLTSSTVLSLTHLNLDGMLNIMSVVSGIISVLYCFVMLGVCFKQVLSENWNFVYLVTEHKSLKLAGRVYELLAILRKIIVAAAFGALTSLPIAQAAVAVTGGFGFMVYSAICNPYSKAYKVFDSISELINIAAGGSAMWFAINPENITAGTAFCASIMVGNFWYSFASAA